MSPGSFPDEYEHGLQRLFGAMYGPPMRRLLLLAMILLAAPVAHAQLKEVAAPAFAADCDDVDLPLLVAAIESETTYIMKKKGGAPLQIGTVAINLQDYAKTTLAALAAEARSGNKAAFCSALKTKFRWFKTTEAPITMTGYHTPFVKGSLTADATFKYPLYKKPTAPRR